MKQDNIVPEKLEKGVGRSVTHSLVLWLDRLYKALIGIAAVAIAIVMLLTTSDVFARKFLNAPIKGTFEIVETSLVLIAGIGIIAISRRANNVRVDILATRFSKSVQHVLVSIGHFVGFVMFGTMSYELWLSAINWSNRGLLTGILKLPYAPIKFTFAVIAGLVSVVLLGHFLLSLFRKKQAA